jgi:C4-dicarboxylate-specific signal transduction histidine kinase
MQTQYDSIGESGLRFFGKVSASISHEMKNVLAIMNENAGLLEDLTLAAQRGKAIDPERLNRTAGNFLKQIHRADQILKNMSIFAHSVDQFSGQVSLHELAMLVANLIGRPAAMRKITLETATPNEPVQLNTNPFLLENLIWLCLEFALTATSAGGILTLTPEKTDAGIRLHIAGIDRLAESFPGQLPAGHEEITAALGAELLPDIGSHTLTLHLT